MANLEATKSEVGDWNYDNKFTPINVKLQDTVSEISEDTNEADKEAPLLYSQYSEWKGLPMVDVIDLCISLEAHGPKTV